MKSLSLKYLIWGAVLTPILNPVNDVLMENFTLLLVVGLLVVLDTILGIVIAAEKKEARSNTFWIKFANKVISYLVFIILCLAIFLLTQTNDHFNIEPQIADHIVVYPMAFMVVREVWSIFENIEVIQPGLTTKFKSMFEGIFKKFTDDNRES